MRSTLLLLVFAAAVGCGSSSSPSQPVADAGTTDAPSACGASAAPSPVCVQSLKPAPYPLSCDDSAPLEGDALDEALARIGADRCSAGYDPSQIWRSGWNYYDPRRMPDYDSLHYYPLRRLPSYGRENAKWLDAALASAQPVSSALAAVEVRLGGSLTRCADATWFAVDPCDAAPLATAILDLAPAYGAKMDATALQGQVSAIPLDLQQALAPVVRAIGFASLDVVAARHTTDPNVLEELASVSLWLTNLGTPPFPFLDAVDRFDEKAMVEAAARVASAVEAAQLDRFAGRDIPAVDIATPFGSLVFRGSGADTYMPGGSADHAALLIDTGGDDVYRVAVATATAKLPLAVSVDLAGNDQYTYVVHPDPQDSGGHRLPSDGAGRNPATLSRTPRQGAGILGVGLLYDLGTGNDSYQSLALSQGMGSFGVGVLFDAGGDDHYAAEIASQGAGIGWGVGLLLDRSGNDNYLGYNASQAAAWQGSVAAVVDGAGNDVYYMEPGDPMFGGDLLYPSNGIGVQDSGQRNITNGQGCGLGIRLDSYPQHIGFLGGLAILRDAAGNDAYTGGVFAQGCGYLGTGMLLEGGGDDVYESLVYSQGSSAHMGIGLLDDEGGNDQYNPTFTTGPRSAVNLGHGHDFSVGVFIDEGGNDAYRGSDMSFGSSDFNGFGLLVDMGGTDTFDAATWFSFGGVLTGYASTDPRYVMPTYGIFAKTGGSASYSREGTVEPLSGTSWTYYADGEGEPWAGHETMAGRSSPAPYESSVGIDRPTGALSP